MSIREREKREKKRRVCFTNLISSTIEVKCGSRVGPQPLKCRTLTTKNLLVRHRLHDNKSNVRIFQVNNSPVELVSCPFRRPLNMRHDNNESEKAMFSSKEMSPSYRRLSEDSVWCVLLLRLLRFVGFSLCSTSHSTVEINSLGGERVCTPSFSALSAHHISLRMVNSGFFCTVNTLFNSGIILSLESFPGIKSHFISAHFPPIG